MLIFFKHHSIVACIQIRKFSRVLSSFLQTKYADRDTQDAVSKKLMLDLNIKSWCSQKRAKYYQFLLLPILVFFGLLFSNWHQWKYAILSLLNYSARLEVLSGLIFSKQKVLLKIFKSDSEILFSGVRIIPLVCLEY